jgi:hypothetical protein
MAAKLDTMRNIGIHAVQILSISADNTFATVKSFDLQEVVTTRIINTPNVAGPLNVNRYNGILFGDIKNPMAVLLIDVSDNLDADISFNGNTAMFGGAGRNIEVPVVGKLAIDENDTLSLDEKANNKNHVHDNMVVIKPQLPPTRPNTNSPLILQFPEDARDIPTGHLMAAEQRARIAADANVGIEVDKTAGVTIAGQLNITCPIGETRIGGMWRLNPMMQFMIPSTAITPIPTLIFSIPGKNLIAGIEEMIKDLYS